MSDAIAKSAKKKKKSVGALGRKEVAAGLCEDLCNIVKDYDIESGDKALPKVIGMLQACTNTVTSLVKNVKESHLTQKLSNELFYASMVLEHEGKETLRRFMIKSMRGREVTKVLSLQKLYKMNTDGEGFLANVEHVEQSVYDKKSLTKSAIRTTGPSEKKLRTELDSLITEIGFIDPDGDYNLVKCDYTVESKEKKDHSNLLEKMKHRKFKEDEANEQIDFAKSDLKKSRDAFKDNKEPCPDQDDDEDDYNQWRKESDAACKSQIDAFKGWKNELKKRIGSFNVVKDDLDEKITLFKEKRADFLARFPDVVGDSESDSSDKRATQKKKRQPEEGVERSEKKSRPTEETAGDRTDDG